MPDLLSLGVRPHGSGRPAGYLGEPFEVFTLLRGIARNPAHHPDDRLEARQRALELVRKVNAVRRSIEREG